MIELTEYRDFSDSSRGMVLVNPDDISAVLPYRYHSFREPVGQVVLKSGVTINVWESVESIQRAIQAAKAAGGTDD